MCYSFAVPFSGNQYLNIWQLVGSSRQTPGDHSFSTILTYCVFQFVLVALAERSAQVTSCPQWFFPQAEKDLHDQSSFWCRCGRKYSVRGMPGSGIGLSWSRSQAWLQLLEQRGRSIFGLPISPLQWSVLRLLTSPACSLSKAYRSYLPFLIRTKRARGNIHTPLSYGLLPLYETIL